MLDKLKPHLLQIGLALFAAAMVPIAMYNLVSYNLLQGSLLTLLNLLVQPIGLAVLWGLISILAALLAIPRTLALKHVFLALGLAVLILYGIAWLAAVVFFGPLLGTLLSISLAITLFVGLAVVMSVISLVVSRLPVTKVPFSYSLRNLQVRWKTSAVTALAFTLVICLLTVMLAFVKGMDKLTEGSGVPGNVMILSDGATDEAFSTLPRSSVQLLPSELQKMIVKNPGGEYLATQEVFVICTHVIPHPEPGGRRRRFVQMRGLDNARIAAEVHQIELAAGGWFSDSGIRKIKREYQGGTIEDTAPEVVLGDGIAKTFGRDLGKATLVPGDVVEIGPRFWYVVGVMEPSNSAFGSEIWAKDTPVGQTFGRRDSYSSYVVRTQDEETGRLAAGLLKEFRSERALSAQTEQQYYASLSQTSTQFRYAVLFVAVVMAIGGVLGVMNTMFAAISQRTKDIGVLRLLGYSRFKILCSFLMESMVIALVGGTLGCLLGLLTDGWTASSIVSSGAGGGGKSVVLRLTVDSSVIWIGLLFTYLMGAVGGLVPALSAMRLKPLESLR